MSKHSHTPTTTRTMRRQGQRMSKEERVAAQDKFIKALSMTANIRAACIASGIDRSTIYYWQEHDDNFALRFNVANQEANDLLLAAAWERGVKGIDKPVVSMGRQVFVAETVNGQKVEKPLMERVYSDSLLTLLIRARMPEFRDKQSVDLNAHVNGNMSNTVTIDPRSLTPEQLAVLKSLATSLKEGE